MGLFISQLQTGNRTGVKQGPLESGPTSYKFHNVLNRTTSCELDIQMHKPKRDILDSNNDKELLLSLII